MKQLIIIALISFCFLSSCTKTTESTENEPNNSGGSTQHPTGEFMGKVVKSGTGGNVFVEGAVVAIAQKSDITDFLGFYWIESIPTGQYTVTVVKSGFNTFTKQVTIYENQNSGIFIELVESK